jgi:uroporphyrin-III C-methyltransferase/precorrin-2 dehydrogenase/sirohydrochlorin ferrochelatase
VADTLPAGRARRSFWQKVFFGSAREAFLSGDGAAFRNEVEAALAEESAPAPGRVSLIGAGPGDPELLTLKAQRRLQEADVIVHDRLVGPQILELARRDAVRIAVGKTPYRPSPRQEEINDILIREAKAGRNVVRLKGGDPYVFGRGAEEQAALEAAGIAFDVVPGITAALGCAAMARMPLTQRGRNQSFTLLTGTSEDGQLHHDWQALAASGSALAIYMGVREAGAIADRLISGGMPPATPVTIVENGTLPQERTLTTSLGRLGETVRSEAIESPALIFVGLSAAQASADIVPFPTREDLREAALRAAS